eukprot:12178253-Heterocapsa_arctica.AAC.1
MSWVFDEATSSDRDEPKWRGDRGRLRAVTSLGRSRTTHIHTHMHTYVCLRSSCVRNSGKVMGTSGGECQRGWKGKVQ